MPSLRYGKYVYLNDFYEKPQRYHEIFINRKIPDITIMTPSRRTKTKIKIVAIFSNIRVFNRVTQSKQNGYCNRQLKNVLDYLDFESFYVVINKFPALIHNMLNEALTFNIYTSQKAINEIGIHITSFE